MISVTFIITLMIILLCAGLGWYRGLFGFVFALISWLVFLLLLNFFSPVVREIFLNSGYLYADITGRIGAFLANRTNGLLTTEQSLVAAMVDKAAVSFINGLAQVVTLAVATLCILIIRNLLHIIDKIPVIGGISRLLGFLTGLLSGLLIVCILYYLVSCFEMTELGSMIIGDIEANPILQQIYLNNPLAGFLS